MQVIWYDKKYIQMRKRSELYLKYQRQPFYIAICDDEQHDIKVIAEMTTQLCKKEGIPFVLSQFDNVKALLDAMETKQPFDLLLLDVMMPNQNGMELAKCLREGLFRGSIVFISNNREMALCGYEVSAARYLAKPLQPEYLREALVYCFHHRQAEKDILLPVTGGTRRVFPQEILYIETQGRRCCIAQEHEEWYTSTSLRISELEMMLQEYGFVRCHQGFLVNMRFIRVLRATELELVNGKKIPVSKHRIQVVRKSFFSYLEN